MCKTSCWFNVPFDIIRCKFIVLGYGARVAIVEGAKYGGTCVNVGNTDNIVCVL